MGRLERRRLSETKLETTVTVTAPKAAVEAAKQSYDKVVGDDTTAKSMQDELMADLKTAIQANPELKDVAANLTSSLKVEKPQKSSEVKVETAKKSTTTTAGAAAVSSVMAIASVLVYSMI